MTGPTAPNAKPGDASPVGCTTEGCQLKKVIKRENLIVVGSEVHYNSFWLKMMFIAAAYIVVSRGQLVRAADITTVAYVKEGYTKLELGTLEQLKNSGAKLVALSGSGGLTAHMNARKIYQEGDTMVTELLQDVVFFSHGLPGVIDLNYEGDATVQFGQTEMKSVGAGVFVPDGRIFSYACRTGNNSINEFPSGDAAVDPQNSLAQKMADHFKVEVHAFLRRSNYGGVLRDASQSDAIAEAMDDGRDGKEGQVIPLPPEHEALPHEGMSSGVRGWWEGTSDYALWRKAGGIALPVAGDTPANLSADMRVFTPGAGGSGATVQGGGKKGGK